MPRALTRSHAPRAQRGVNLIELSISLAVLAVVAAGILVPLVTQIEQRNVATTESTIADVKDALLGFAAVNGRLPCPAPVNAATGVEVFTGTGNALNGECADFWGYVPAQALGVTPVDTSGFALDAWGNRIRYAVTSVTVGGIAKAFTRTDGIRSAGLVAIATTVASSPPVLLQVCAGGAGVNAGVSCNSAGTTTNELTPNAVVVIWSTGSNARTSGGTGTDEAQNPNPRNEASKDVLFVSRTRSDIAGNPFDDVVNWLSVNTLVNRMVAAGQLP